MNADHRGQDLLMNKDPKNKREVEKDGVSVKFWKANSTQDDAREDSAKKRHQESLARKFKEERELVEKLEAMPEKFKDHTLPLARIKKIMKSDEDVKMISAEAPVLFSKACELFIKDITYRALYYTNFNKRKTLQRSDIAATVNDDEMFDFLIDIIPRDESAKDYQARRVTEDMIPPQANRNPPKPMYNNTRHLYAEPQNFMKNPLSSTHMSITGSYMQLPRQINNSNFYGLPSQADPSEFGADDFMSERSHFGLKSKK